MQKKKKDAGAPKRPMSAYMMWLNASRERIKSENPGISITEISKKAGEMWRQLGKDEKEVRGGRVMEEEETRGCAGSNVVVLELRMRVQCDSKNYLNIYPKLFKK